MHVVDNSTLSGNGLTRKFKPVLDVLCRTFLSNYSPSQELSVDEAMIRYKGHIRGKVRMPNNPIRRVSKCGVVAVSAHFKFRPSYWKIHICKGNGHSSCQGLGRPFSCFNHVVYMDNYFTSGPIVEELAQDNIYVAGTIKQIALGFPESLKSVKLSKGNYACERVGDIYVIMFLRAAVRCALLSNVLPEAMETQVSLTEILQFQSIPLPSITWVA